MLQPRPFESETWMIEDPEGSIFLSETGDNAAALERTRHSLVFGRGIARNMTTEKMLELYDAWRREAAIVVETGRVATAQEVVVK